MEKTMKDMKSVRNHFEILAFCKTLPYIRTTEGRVSSVNESIKVLFGENISNMPRNIPASMLKFCFPNIFSTVIRSKGFAECLKLRRNHEMFRKCNCPWIRL